MENKPVIEVIPSRIKYYLLDWKDRYMEEYISMMGDKRLCELTMEQLDYLFAHVSDLDRKCIINKLV